jgi:hypothetical protein
MKSSIRIALAAALLSSMLFSLIAPTTVHAVGPATSVIEVYPSGDTTGATDHLNIQNAMDSLEPGGKVVLAAGHFYINAGIVVEGFNGTLQGSLQGKKVQTTLEAVAPFIYTHLTSYLSFPAMPSMLFFEFPENEVEVKDLILQALAPDYVEARSVWGITTTALFHFIADFGGDVDVTYRNLALIAAQGDYFGSNVVFGIHSMRGPACADYCDRIGDPNLHGSGKAVFTGIEASNLFEYTIAPMWYRDGTLKIADISSDAMLGAYGMINMEIDITNVYSAGSWRAIWLEYVAGGNTRVKGLLHVLKACWQTEGSARPSLFNLRKMSISVTLRFRAAMASVPGGAIRSMSEETTGMSRLPITSSPIFTMCRPLYSCALTLTILRFSSAIITTTRHISPGHRAPGRCNWAATTAS